MRVLAQATVAGSEPNRDQRSCCYSTLTSVTCMQPKPAAKRVLDESDSDESEGNTPLAKRVAASKVTPRPAAKPAPMAPAPKAAAAKPAAKPVANGAADSDDDDSSDEDQTPLAKRCGLWIPSRSRAGWRG